MKPSDLKPFAEQVRAHFKVRAKVEIEFNIENESTYSGEVTIILGHGDDFGVFSAPTFEEAFEKAKAEYKPKDPVRIAAAQKLRQQADAIERGELSPTGYTPHDDLDESRVKEGKT